MNSKLHGTTRNPMRARSWVFLRNREWLIPDQYPADSAEVRALVLKFSLRGFEFSHVTN